MNENAHDQCAFSFCIFKIILIVCSSGQVKNHKNFIFMGGTKNVQNTVLSFILIGKESFTINMIYIKDACFLKYM